ncbi:MAG: WG repeat-containing protein [Bacteroidetes bacterium]|nr:WG repeat-containing protein [Bacteroidota bacterium]
MTKNILSLTCLSLLTAHTLLAGDLDRAFKNINSGDYDKARASIKEELDKDPKDVAANYAMAKLFSARDYKAMDLDSATIYVNKAFAAIPLKEDDKQTKKYLKYGVRDFTIQELFADINKQAYDKAKAKNTFDSYDHFIQYSQDKILNEQAEDKRDDIKFAELSIKQSIPSLIEESRTFLNDHPKSKRYADINGLYELAIFNSMTYSNDVDSFKAYLDRYPTGPYAKEARVQYDRKIYEVYLKRGTIEGYAEFEKSYPKNPFLAAVQDSIYTMSTRKGDVWEYNTFIKAYPSNRNIMNAWNQLYDLYTQDATDSSYEAFLKAYPNNPFKDKIQQDIYLSQLNLAPFKSNDKWGYVNPKTQTLVIQPQYEDASEFSGGLAAVALKACTDNCMYSYIDKNGKVAFEKAFASAGDFIGGKAVVALDYCDGAPCKFGIINRKGEFVVGADYEDIQPLSEGLYAAHNFKGYGFINDRDHVVIPFVYQDATSFSEGLAAVKKDDRWVFIDRSGTQPFTQSFANVSAFSSGLAAVTENDSTYGYIDHSGAWVIQPIYENAEPFEGDTAIVSLKDDNKKSKDYGMTIRYRIDKTGKNLGKLVNPNVATKPKAAVKKKKK